MNAFSFCNRSIEDYSRYVSSFVSSAQSRLRDFVDRGVKFGSLWPDPLIQQKPTFKRGKTVAELVQERVLAPDCSQAFRCDKATTVGRLKPLPFSVNRPEFATYYISIT